MSFIQIICTDLLIKPFFIEKKYRLGTGIKVKVSVRAVRYEDIYRMDEIKSLSFHIMFYRFFRGVTKYIVYGNNLS